MDARSLSSRRKPRPVLRFRVRPFSKRKEYIIVRVWKDKATMIAYSTLNDGCANEDTGAYCHSYDRFVIKNGKPDALQSDFAEVNFHLGQLNTEIVTHELFHATMAMVYRMGFLDKLVERDPNTVMCNDAEEDAAYAHGRMCRLVVNKLHDAQVWS